MTLCNGVAQVEILRVPDRRRSKPTAQLIAEGILPPYQCEALPLKLFCNVWNSAREARFSKSGAPTLSLSTPFKAGCAEGRIGYSQVQPELLSTAGMCSTVTFGRFATAWESNAFDGIHSGTRSRPTKATMVCRFPFCNRCLAAPMRRQPWFITIHSARESAKQWSSWLMFCSQFWEVHQAC